MIRVTQPLKPFANFGQVHPDVLDYASKRGTAVHQACHLYAQGKLAVTGNWPSDYHGYFESFKKWFHRYVNEVIATEIELKDDDLDLVGHPDLLCVMEGDTSITLVDLKTPSTESRTWRPQIAAYRHLALKNNYDIVRAGSLRIKKDGSRAIFNGCDDSAADWAAYMNILMIEKYFGGK